MEAREHLCSDSAPYIVVDTIRLLVEQQGCLSICADGRVCKGMTNYCPGSHHVGLEEEGAGKGGKLRVFPLCVSFLLLNKKKNKQTKTTQNQQSQQKFGLLQLFSSLLTDKNRENLFGLKRQAVPGCGPTTTAQYVGGSHTHFLPFPSCLSCSQHSVPICKTPSWP